MVNTGEAVKLKTTEHDSQASFVKLFALKHPEESLLLFAIPNGAMLGGANKYAIMNKLRAEGFKNGVPDLFLAISRDDFAACQRVGYRVVVHGLFLEFKSEKGIVSAEQEEWHRQLDAQGYAVAVVRSCEEALSTVRKYLRGEL